MYMVRTAVGCKVTELDLEEIGYESFGCYVRAH
jgi:hypothetical protein